MESSDDESVIVPEFVSNYHFVDDNSEPISFSVLPITWATSEIVQSSRRQIDLHGYIDGGLQKFYKPIRAWKFDISGEEPEVLVLCKDNNWLRLQKPRKCYQATIRSVLVTVNFLHLVKKNPELKKKAVWSKLSDIFSYYDDKSSQKDLVQNKTLIKEAVKQDESLRRSEYLVAILEQNPQRKDDADEGASTKGNKDFIVDDEEEDVSGEEDGGSQEDDADEEPFDSVCCICDNGGSLLCCEGVCMRSFHATLEAAEEADSGCVSLGLTEKEVKEIPNFKCKNCQYKQHQCFSCGQLGSSDKSLGAEVFQCASATCGYFYHPRCVAKVLHRGSEVAAKELQDKIVAGESFACPLHVCYVCKQPEDKTIPELQMAVCRRCPKAYHEKCLPRKIAFEENEEEGIVERAWRDLLVDRILIYCLKHEILDELGTPERNHIKFPGDEKKEKQQSASVFGKDTFSSKRKNQWVGATCQIGSAIQSKKRSFLVGDLDKKSDRRCSKIKGTDPSKKTSNEKMPVLTKSAGSFRAEEQRISSGDHLHALYTRSDFMKPSKSDKVDEDEVIKTCAVKTLVPQLDPESEGRILDVMKEASSIVTMDDIIVKYKKTISSTYEQKVDTKAITQGKVQKSCESIRAAIQKLDGGGSIEDAKNLCGPKVLNQVIKWKSKLRVYLAPFLNGMRYTSFGRHFTKIDKLQEIVDKIHWYVNNGDTIVDFCCGANDFSWLMKQKLEQTGKNCFYKNYDLFQPKNDFGFEKRDWLSVETNELPPGSKLVMGLNPPFGVKASRANQFIDKALQFQPKLLILIVPQETERLEKKKTRYDLVWEDSEKLSGKSFYLPGSVDVNDKQIEDWNKVTPSLYLWSRHDWTTKHKAIAEKYRHLHGKIQQQQVCPSQFENQVQSSAVVMEADDGCPNDDLPDELLGSAAGAMSEVVENQSAHSDLGEKLVKSLDNRGSRKRRHNRQEQRRRNREEQRRHNREEQRRHSQEKRMETIEALSEHKQKHSSPSNHRHGRPHQLPDLTVDGRHSLECYTSRHQRNPSDMEIEQKHSSPSNRLHGKAHQLPDLTMAGRHSLEQYSSGHQRAPSDMEIELRSSPSNRHHDGPHQLPDPTKAGRHSLERFSSRHQRAPSDMEIEHPAYEAPIQLPNHDAPAYGRRHDRYQIGSYPDRSNHYNTPEIDPYSVGRERWSIDAGTQSSNWAPGYMREQQGFGFNQASQGEVEPRHGPSTYSMGGSYSRMNSMPVSERYALRLDEQNNPRMAQFGMRMTHEIGAGAGVYDHQGLGQRYVNDHMGFAPAPANYRPPHRGPTGGWFGNE